jgi:hypothetical protein
MRPADPRRLMVTGSYERLTRSRAGTAIKALLRKAPLIRRTAYSGRSAPRDSETRSALSLSLAQSTPDWGETFFTSEWLADHACPDWAIPEFNSGWVENHHDLYVLERRR